MSALDVRLQPFQKYKTLHQLIKATELPSGPVKDIERLKLVEALEALKKNMQDVFVATDQCTSIMMELLELGAAYIRRIYGEQSHQQIVSRVYQPGLMKENPIEIRPPIHLSGLPGVGKSALIFALERLLPAPPAIPIPGGSLIHIPIVVSRANGKSTQRAMLQDFARPGPMPRSLDGLIDDTVNWLYTICAGLICADELQFLAHSKASINVSKTIMSIGDLRVQAVIGCNFNVLHKLVKEPAQIQARTLDRVIYLHPESPGTRDWKKILSAQCNVCDGAIESAVFDAADQLWEMSAGINRHLVSLLLLAFRKARMRGAKIAKMEDVVSAYNSGDFLTQRNQVEFLIGRAAGLKVTRSAISPTQKLDLECPFPEGNRLTSDYQLAATERSQAQFDETLVIDSMTRAEKEALKKIPCSHVPNARPSSASIHPIRKKADKPSSKMEEQSAANVELMEAMRSKRKKK